MSWEFVRKEWGAVTFVLTVVVGMVIVPLALYFANQGPSPIALPTPNTASGAHVASAAQTAGGAKTSPSPTR